MHVESFVFAGQGVRELLLMTIARHAYAANGLEIVWCCANLDRNARISAKVKDMVRLRWRGLLLGFQLVTKRNVVIGNDNHAYT